MTTRKLFLHFPKCETERPIVYHLVKDYGLIINIFQAATQINEMTLTFVPKLIATFVTLVVAGPWMIGKMTDFMRQLFESIPSLIG